MTAPTRTDHPHVLIVDAAGMPSNDATEKFLESLPEALSAASVQRVTVAAPTAGEAAGQVAPFMSSECRTVVVWIDDGGGDSESPDSEDEGTTTSLRTTAALLSAGRTLTSFHVVTPTLASDGFRTTSLLYGSAAELEKVRVVAQGSGGSSYGAELPPVNGIISYDTSSWRTERDYSIWDVYGVGTGSVPFGGTMPLAVVVCGNADAASATRNGILRGYEYWFWFKKLGTMTLPPKWPQADFELVPRLTSTLATRTTLAALAAQTNNVDYQVFPEGTLPVNPSNYTYTPSGADRVYAISKRRRNNHAPYGVTIGYLVVEAANNRLHWVIDTPNSASRLDCNYYESLRFTDITASGALTASSHHVLSVTKYNGLP